MRRSTEEIVKFLAPESIHTYYWKDEEDFCDYVTGFTYISPKHILYNIAKERKMTIKDFLAGHGELIPHKFEMINNMMDIYFD